jgi:carbon monoxide dehydrogenase subunit G
MSKLKRDIEIKASPDEVWDVLMDPQHLGDWVTIQDGLEEAPRGDLEKGSTLVQRCKVAGQRFNLRWTVVEAEKPERAVWEGKGPLGTKATVIYELAQNGGGTHFNYTNEYTLPGGFAGRLGGAAVMGASGHEANKTLKRLKKLVESKNA